MTNILRCTFPFPHQTPPAQVSDPCVQCPNADRRILDLHAQIARDDPELVVALRSFADWFFSPEAEARDAAENLRYAADLYTRGDHSGTCIPKTILFAYYKGMQFSDGEAPPLSDAARAALKGLPVASWPDRVLRSGGTWDELFGDYGRRYD